MATSSSSAVTVTKVWPLDKYARFIPEQHHQVLPQRDSTKKGGSWKVNFGIDKGRGFQEQLFTFCAFILLHVMCCGLSLQHYQSTRDCCIQMALLESNHLMVSSGTQIYVCTTLPLLRGTSMIISSSMHTGKFLTVECSEVDKGCNKRRQHSFHLQT